MEFKKIESLHLEHGKEYKLGHHYRGIYTGIYTVTRCRSKNFPDGVECMLEFDVRCLLNPKDTLKMSFSPDAFFGEFSDFNESSEKDTLR
jgi:hypothetical protein